MYRHRGHRYISMREFDRAIVDFEAASPELTPLFFVSQEFHNPIGKVRKSPIDVGVKVK